MRRVLRFLWAIFLLLVLCLLLLEYAQFTSCAKAGSSDIGLVEYMEGVFWLEGRQEVGKLGFLSVRSEVVSFETFRYW